MELVLGAADVPPGGQLTEPTRRQILSGSTGTAFAIIAGQAAAGLSFLVLARRLAPSEFGTYAVLYTAGVVLGGVLDFGSSQLRTRELARGAGLDSFTSWLWHRAAWQTPVVFVAVGLSQVAIGNKASLLVTVALLSQGLTYPISLGWSGAVRALRSPALGTWLVAVGNVLLLVVVIAAPRRLLVESAAVGASASWLVTAVCSWWFIRSRLSPARTRWTKNPWSGSTGFGFFALAVALHGLQVVIVGAVAGSAEAGELAAVARWVQPVYLVAAAFSTQTFPSMAALHPMRPHAGSCVRFGSLAPSVPRLRSRSSFSHRGWSACSSATTTRTRSYFSKHWRLQGFLCYSPNHSPRSSRHEVRSVPWRSQRWRR